MPASAGFPFFVGMPPQAPGPFRGMAPMAARRARLVQRSGCQGLRGNPDACRPRRGSACSVSANRAGGNADPVFASPVQPTAAMSPRTGGARVGEAPRPFFPPISLGRNGGARRAGAPPGAPRQVDGAPRSSRPTDSGGWAGIREPLIRPGVRTGEGGRRVRDAAPHNIPRQKEFLFYNSICCAEAEFLV